MKVLRLSIFLTIILATELFFSVNFVSAFTLDPQYSDKPEGGDVSNVSEYAPASLLFIYRVDTGALIGSTDTSVISITNDDWDGSTDFWIVPVISDSNGFGPCANTFSDCINDETHYVSIVGYQRLFHIRNGYINFVPPDNHTTEDGYSVNIPITLSIAPLANVDIPVTVSDWTEGTTTTSLLTFTPSDWNIPQTVTVTGVDDFMLDGDISYDVSFGPIQSTDLAFNGKSALTINLVNYDDEVAPPVIPISIENFSLSTTSIPYLGEVVISWNALGTISACTASSGWSGIKDVSGSELVQNISTSTDFVISCEGPGGSDTKTLSIDVGEKPPVLETISQGGTGNHGPCVGYGCGKINRENPRVLGSFCEAYISKYLGMNLDNDPLEVQRLQEFLNENEGNHLIISEVFDEATDLAVRAFQSKYAEDILAPWGINEPTGLVYITTTSKINEINCSHLSIDSGMYLYDQISQFSIDMQGYKNEGIKRSIIAISYKKRLNLT